MANAQEVEGECDGQQDHDEGDVGLAAGNGEKVNIDGPEDEVLCGQGGGGGEKGNSAR